MKSEPTTDHDLIIALTVKVDRLIQDVKEIKDGTAVDIADLKKRVDTLEEYHAKYPAEELVPRFNSLERSFTEQQLTSKERVRLTATVASVITFILTTVGAIIGIVTGVIQLGG